MHRRRIAPGTRRSVSEAQRHPWYRKLSVSREPGGGTESKPGSRINGINPTRHCTNSEQGRSPIAPCGSESRGCCRDANSKDDCAPASGSLREC